MRRIFLFLIIGIFLVSGCAEVEPKIPKEKECTVDDDCTTGGCSGQICGPKDKVSDIITTCEWKEEYGCYQKTACSCINYKCQWKETKEFLDCIEAVK